MKILVIDDDRYIGLLLHEILTDEGHRIVTAFDGLSGLASFKAESPDLVLLDVNLPIMNGCEVAREIKDCCVDRFVPVIFLTALSGDQELAKCLDSGGDDFFIKPFNRTLLEAKLRSWARNIDWINHREGRVKPPVQRFSTNVLSLDEIGALLQRE
ncbi:MAG: response regulator [Magnetococcus sp. DMHC-6]